MLKALEISGFKSFADKTRFEFPPGITVVVGPNGSGKSNIVDAIKWVLGEQSAKSLRGKDMSDVIFKGSSGANARKASASASATLILENTDRRLMHDAPEVHVTRRVYRSGESEYLVNNEPCRLKDIRNLFRGTGVGTDAYSLIEQGKVDRLLQASARDRRGIFEEAAGISRFKAKKVEAERRLERVEANLVRLADIVEEVGSRYRSIKSQAAKAARYKDLTKRLQELRTFVGVKDFRSFSGKLQSNEAELLRLSEALQLLQNEIAESQSANAKYEEQLDATAPQVNQLQETVSTLREAIAQAESAIELNRHRKTDLAQRREQVASQITRHDQRIDELKQLVAANESELNAARTTAEQANSQVSQLTSQSDALALEIADAVEIGESSRNRHAELLSLVAELTTRIAGAASQLDSGSNSERKLAGELAQLESESDKIRVHHEGVDKKRKAVEHQAGQNDSALRDATKSVESLESSIAQHQQRLGDVKTRFAGVSQRAKVIEELEKRLEGIHAGAKELLQQARAATGGPLRDVVGLVADLIQVNVQHAALVDAALGNIAQFVVVDGTELIQEIEAGRMSVSGRVTLVSLNQHLDLRTNPNLDLSQEPEVIGPVNELVQISARHNTFVKSLLAGTWIVKSLSDGLRLQTRYVNQARFVTLDGEIIESDGTLVVGPKSAVMGIVSRRSELRSLNAEQQELKGEVGELEQSLAQLKKELQAGQSQVKKLIGQNQTLVTQLNELASQSEAAQYQLKTLKAQSSKTQVELSGVRSHVASLQNQLETDRGGLVQRELVVTKLLEAMDDSRARLATAQQQRTQIDQQATSAKVMLAKCEQQLHDLESRVDQHQSQLSEYQTAWQTLNEQLVADELAMKEADKSIALANDTLNTRSAEREQTSEQLNELLRNRTEIDGQRKGVAEQLQQQRNRLRRIDEQHNDCTVRARQLVLERDQLSERLREDYGLEVTQLLETETPEQAESREEIDREITELRQKIGSVGAVNMQALAELEELESRYQALDTQYQDLASARESLLKIIHKINQDSRRLFVETLEAIRINFQKLFRQTFGGGQADIVLEEGVDVLEAGVEIIATPPGKPKFNNSLLSGGEKALTAVSLLMAIFQFRPSPFCVLDEVDAPFDEANIGRFIDVLKSFLGWTKFVIVTHSKKTMTAATTLYGITMQESGVSKRVSVRFEDVSDDGHISDDAVRRSTNLVEPSTPDEKSAVA